MHGLMAAGAREHQACRGATSMLASIAPREKLGRSTGFTANGQGRALHAVLEVRSRKTNRSRAGARSRSKRMGHDLCESSDATPHPASHPTLQLISD